MHRSAALAAIAAGAAVALAGPAAAQQKLFDDFRDDGQIDPCAYSPGELRRGLEALPPDVRQYAPGLADQLRRPCARGGGGQQGRQDEEAAPSPGGRRRPPGASRERADVPRPPAPSVRAAAAIDAPVPPPSAGPRGSDAPDWLLALLAALGAGALAALVARRYGGLSAERFTRPLRAGFVEAGGRTADAVAALRDRLTPGR